MKAAVFHETGHPLSIEDLGIPEAGPKQVRIKVRACGVCRTDLHLLDGELPDPKNPVIPGHQIVGTVDQIGEDTFPLEIGDRVGVPWLGSTCGQCRHCVSGRENLCDDARFTGYTLDGGFAEYTLADHRFCFPLPAEEYFSDLQAAPLLCAGLIGYRALRLCGSGAKSIGLYGFGAAAHIIAQVVRYNGGTVYAFTRPGDAKGQAFARGLGAVWAGDSDQPPPEELDAAIIFAAAGELVPAALKAIRKGGRVICGGIHMSDIPSFPYADLWGERRIESVANLTRQDGYEFLDLAPKVPVKTSLTTFPLEQANEALQALRQGQFRGAAVLTMPGAES